MKKGRGPRRWILILLGVPLAISLCVLSLVIWGPRLVNTAAVKEALCMQITEATGLDASLADVKLRFRGGIEIQGRRLVLGSADQNEPFMEIPQIRAKLAWKEALRREISIRSVVLNGLKLSLGGTTSGRALEQRGIQRLTSLLSVVRHVQIVNAHLFWEDSTFRIRKFKGDLWPSNDDHTLVFRGGGEAWQKDVLLGGLHGRGTLDPQGTSRVFLDCKGLALSALRQTIMPGASSLALGGRGDLRLKVEGSQEEGRFQGSWKVEGLEVVWPDRLAKPFSAEQADASFQGEWSETAWSLTQFKADAGFVHTEGHAKSDRDGIRGRVMSGPFRFQDVIPHLGEGLIGEKLMTFFRNDLGPGKGRKTTFTFHWGAGGKDQGKARLRELRMALDFQGASLVFDRDLSPLRELSGTLFWEGDRVWFRNLRGTYKGHPFRSMEARITEIGRVSLLEGRFALDLTPNELLELSRGVSSKGSAPASDDALEGFCSFDVALEKALLRGTPVNYLANVDLQSVTGKVPQAPLNWNIATGHVKATPDQLDIVALRGTLEEASLRVQGSVENWSDPSPRLALDGQGMIPGSAIHRLVSTRLSDFQTDPDASSTVAFAIEGNIREPRVELSWDLTPVGMRYGDYWQKPSHNKLAIDAQLHRTADGVWRIIRGTARGEGGGEIRGEGAWCAGQAKRSWLKLETHGHPVDEVAKRIPLLQKWIHGGTFDMAGEVGLGGENHWKITVQPHDVHVAKEIIGHDLRVRSGKLTLTESWSQADPMKVEVLGKDYTLWGQLRPLGQGFSFKGRVRGEEADLDPWIFPEDEKKGSERKEGLSISAFQKLIVGLPSSELTFEFDRLRLLDLQFQDLKGRMVADGKRLVLADTFCTLEGGQMTAEGHLNATGEFWIAGGVDGAESGDVFSSLGFHEEIIEGPLFMQFGVKGRLMGRRAGRHLGNIELEVDRGVIHKFPMLASVLSLMNVSQILTGRLPDLSSEGMVFRKIKGSFFLKNGVASTEDFRIHSESMGVTMVGDLNVITRECDFTVGVEPFVGLNRVVDAIPVIRHYLAGPDRSLIGLDFLVNGPLSNPQVKAAPFSSLGGGILRFFKRLVENPFQDLGAPSGPLPPFPDEEELPH